MPRIQSTINQTLWIRSKHDEPPAEAHLCRLRLSKPAVEYMACIDSKRIEQIVSKRSIPHSAWNIECVYPCVQCFEKLSIILQNHTAVLSSLLVFSFGGGELV